MSPKGIFGDSDDASTGAARALRTSTTHDGSSNDRGRRNSATLGAALVVSSPRVAPALHHERADAKRREDAERCGDVHARICRQELLFSALPASGRYASAQRICEMANSPTVQMQAEIPT
ncbi:hypothetical protein K437DRAFT_267815 [Tilletiaria anomala UBC 951]|uniref:Uncharacterized protein n=1 Tax=Tilletiaria anomala (strain ATCC 24038 / CBS 436.72 / UBC 951) TaxID=1037660 RepID=A0A066W8W7_TILAU|nr:uncharacterized protein K437DRAFT_267815 [Tilletiaria anomala UBC 951]KDN47524.1 hypothetical protein K437DRAFT_267815 [Tilletiaria anomala UBC 951]